jgi:hypothetical protein
MAPTVHWEHIWGTPKRFNQAQAERAGGAGQHHGFRPEPPPFVVALECGLVGDGDVSVFRCAPAFTTLYSNCNHFTVTAKSEAKKETKVKTNRAKSSTGTTVPIVSH